MSEMIPAFRRTPHFTVRWYRIAPNAIWEVATTGEVAPSFASFKLAGCRTTVENTDTGDDWADGTWQYDNDDPRCQRLYIHRYVPGRHVMQAGPDGMEFLCFLRVSPRPPRLSHVVVDGDFIVPPNVGLFIPAGAVTDGDRAFVEYDYRLPAESETLINGVADALLVEGKIR